MWYGTYVVYRDNMWCGIGTACVVYRGNMCGMEHVWCIGATCVVWNMCGV